MEIPLIDKLETFLNYDIIGLIALVLFIFFVLILYVIKKKDIKTPVINIIKPFMFFVLALIIVFFVYRLLDKPRVNEWNIKGDIELRNSKNEILNHVKTNSCGKPLIPELGRDNFLKKNLKIAISPVIPTYSLVSNTFSTEIPENFGKKIPTIIFTLNGFHCISNNCRLELNASNYNQKIKIIFVKNQPYAGDCSSLEEP